MGNHHRQLSNIRRTSKELMGAKSFGGSSSSSMLKTIIALAIWIGPIYVNMACITAFFFFLPSSPPHALMILGLLLLFIMIPLNHESKLGGVISRFICRQACRYFPVTLHIEDINAFHPNQSYVFGYEPHSVFPVGIFSLLNPMGFMPLPNTKFLSSSIIFYIPFLRQIWAWLGFTPATRQNFISLLQCGYSCIIIPGGMREVLHMEPTSEVVFLKERKGFVRIALETGRPLVPVFCFGQVFCIPATKLKGISFLLNSAIYRQNTYKWWKPSGKWYSSISRAIRFTPIIFWGLAGSPLPYRNIMHVVVGKPIEVKKNPQPTMEEVSNAHNQFTAALQELFEKHKASVGHDDLQLQII